MIWTSRAVTTWDVNVEMLPNHTQDDQHGREYLKRRRQQGPSATEDPHVDWAKPNQPLEGHEKIFMRIIGKLEVDVVLYEIWYCYQDISLHSSLSCQTRSHKDDDIALLFSWVVTVDYVEGSLLSCDGESSVCVMIRRHSLPADEWMCAWKVATEGNRAWQPMQRT